MTDVFVSVDRKLKRVPEHIKAIQSCVDAYSASYVSELVPNSQGKSNLNITVPDTLDISVLAGEAIYEMRSALDHLAFELVQLNPTGAKLPRDWDIKCQFPLCMNFGPNQSPPLPYGFFNGLLPGITQLAHAIIEPLQPYYRIGEVNNSLGFLQELSKIDKHRHLAFTRPRNQISTRRAMAGGYKGTSYWAADNGAEVDLRDGDTDSSPMDVDVTLALFVTFNEPILGEGPCTWSVQELLESMLRSVEGFVVPAMYQLIKNP